MAADGGAVLALTNGEEGEAPAEAAAAADNSKALAIIPPKDPPKGGPAKLTVFLVRQGETILDETEKVAKNKSNNDNKDKKKKEKKKDKKKHNNADNNENANVTTLAIKSEEDTNKENANVTTLAIRDDDNNNNNNANTVSEDDDFDDDDSASDDDSSSSSSNAPLRLHQKMDPPLANAMSYIKAGLVWGSFFDGLVKACQDNSYIRKMACFAAPYTACNAMAAMMSMGGLQAQECLSWRYTTVSAADSPTAIPIHVVNELAAGNPEIVTCGGTQAVVNAGLLHCAAEEWNDARPKCPFMRAIVCDWKETAKETIQAWKDERGVKDTIRRVIDVQYLRSSTEENGGDLNDVWNLQDLTPQVNMVIDLIPPKRYMTPPRKGGFERKMGTLAEFEKIVNKGPEQAVQQCIWKARLTGCDTVFIVVPSATMEAVANNTNLTANGNNTVPKSFSALALASYTASTDGTGPDGVQLITHGYFTAKEIRNMAVATIPRPFQGNVDCIVLPPPDKDPDSVPPGQWSKFPLPKPENIPPDYPDLPPFSEALDLLDPADYDSGKEDNSDPD